ncbi:hypothetical protein ILT06_31855 [Bacillus sp. 17RED48]|uniref:Uncharacterized protein n=1 Tax=Bacillus mycoides TaxID=1405 RepID=A0A1W6AIL2_BACMY|nr:MULTISPECIES: hypothetical protein [Bacillus]ARJ25693.1 hypothetical protein B7492_32175 [Bacillus mycoides]MBY7115378.1 hypothetical protein [Bacillus sp. 17RED48]
MNVNIKFHIAIGIRNIGKSIAKYPAIRLKALTKLYGLDAFGGHIESGLPQLYHQTHLDRKNNGFMFAGGSNDIIHPYTHIPVITLTDSINEQYLNGQEKFDNEENLHFISYELFAESCEPTKGTISVSLKEIQKICGFNNE